MKAHDAWVFIRICFGCRTSGEKQAIEKGRGANQRCVLNYISSG